MSTSSVPVVFAKFMETVPQLLVGKGEKGNDVRVRDGGDYSSWTADEVWIQDVEEGITAIPTIKAGRKKREEEYRITLLVRTLRGERLESRDCAFAHMAEVEDWFAETPDLGIEIATLRLTSFEWTYQGNYDEGVRGWRTTISMKPHVQIRLS
jgi:hypothetical protein